MTTENKQEKILHQKHKETQNKPALGEKKKHTLHKNRELDLATKQTTTN